MQPFLHFCWGSGFEEEFQSFDQVCTGFLDRVALACDIQFRAK